MNFKKSKWYKTISLLLICSFVFINPSQASLIDALKPSQSDSQKDIPQIDNNLEGSTRLQITDPEKIMIAENIGRVREIFKGQGSKLIINIQDAHCNFEAQTNISQILDGLVKENGVKFVALEGSTGEIDPSIFTTFPDEEIRKEVAIYFMKKGKINGAEYLAITSKNPPQLYGVETKEYYLKNLNAFINTLEGRNTAKSACLDVRGILEKLKDHIYPKGLQELDSKILAYKNNKINFVSYYEYLKKAADAKKIPLEAFPNLKFLYKTIDIEKTIDFNKVEAERSRVITDLEKGLSQKELEELFSKSISFKNNQITAVEYYTYLRRITQAKKYDFTKTPNLNLYVEYLIIYEKVDSQDLFKEIDALTDAIKEKFFTNDNQRTLDKLSKNIRLLENMLDISMSKKDVEYYEENKNEFRSQVFVDFIKAQTKKLKIPFTYDQNFALVDKYLPDLENFYRIANTRDDAIIENTIKKMEEEKIQVAALITGGYHTEGIAERLRTRGISYIVIAPRITKPDQNNPYLSILSSEKAPTGADLNINSQHLAINSGMEKDGGNYGIPEREFTREVSAALNAAKTKRDATKGPANELLAANLDPARLELAQRLAFEFAPPGPGMVFEMDAIESDTTPSYDFITVTGISFIGEPDSAGNQEKVISIAKPFDLPSDVFDVADNLIEWRRSGVAADDPGRDLKLHVLRVFDRHLQLSPNELIRQMQSGKAAPHYCMAALMEKGFVATCAHRGDLLSTRPDPTIPVNIDELEKAIDHMINHKLAVTLNAEQEGKKIAKPNPIYLIPEGEMRETISADMHYMRVTFKASEGLRAGRTMTFEVRVQGNNPPMLYYIEGPADNETATFIPKPAQEISKIRDVLEEYFLAKRNHAKANTAQVQAAAVRNLKKTAVENAKFELVGLQRRLELEPANAENINQQIVAYTERLKAAEGEAKTAETAYQATNTELRTAMGRVQAVKAKGFPDLHRTLIGKGEYRENLLGAYLGSDSAIAFNSGIFWNLKRVQNIQAVLRDPALQKRLAILSAKLQGFAKLEEEAFDNADPAIFSSKETDTISQALVSLADMNWMIQEALKAVEGVEDLSGRRRQGILNEIADIPEILRYEGGAAAPAAKFTLPQPVSLQLIHANTILERMDAVLDSIDYQMETRGRDSLGFAGTFTFKNRAEFESFLELLQEADRIESDIRGLTPEEKEKIADLVERLKASSQGAAKAKQLQIAVQIEELQNVVSGKQRLEAIRERLAAEHDAASGAEKSDIAHSIEELNHIVASGTLKDEFLFRARNIRDMTNLAIRISDPAQDANAPVSVTFIYKTAERVGRLGDNVAHIRNDMRSDRLLRILLGLDDKIDAFSLVSHTRWASCGTISEQNCHPVDSEGVYQFADRAATERQIFKFVHPLYPGNDITIAVLNGDITNYVELRKRYEQTEIPGGGFRTISPRITTDTKVIPIIIELYLQKGYSLEEAVWLAGKEFEGSFAIQVTSHLEPGKMYLLQAGEGQELNIGISRDGFHPASEVYGFVRETQQYVKLKPKAGEGVVAVIDRNLEPWAENIKYCMFTRKHTALPTITANRALQDLQAAAQAPITRAARLRQDAMSMAELLTTNIGAIPEGLRPEILLATAAAIQQASILNPSQNLGTLRDNVRGLIQGIYGTYAPLTPHQATLDQALMLLNQQPANLNLVAFSDSLSNISDQLIAARAQMVTYDFASNFQRLAACSSIISTLGSMQGALRETARTTLDGSISDIEQKLNSFTTQLCGSANALSPDIAQASVQYIYAVRNFLVSITQAKYPLQDPAASLTHAGLGQYIPAQGAPILSLAAATDEMAKYTMMAKTFSRANIERTPLTGRDTYLPKGFSHYLIKELNQGPDMLRATCRGKIGIRTEKGREIPDINLDANAMPPAFIEKIIRGEIKRVVFTGMGTADTAAGAVAEILRSYLISLNDILKEAGIPPVSIETLSELATNASAFDIREDMSDTLVVAISQSGGTTDTNAYLSKASLERVAGKGALLLGIINKRESDMDKAIRNVKDQHGNPAGGVIYTGTGRDVEIAVASTKAFYAQIAAGSIISMDFVRELAKKFEQQYPNKKILERVDALLVEDIRELQALPAKMRSVLDAIKEFPEHAVHEAATSAALGCIEWAIMGGGPGYFAAKEGRIKLGELCFKSFQELFLSGSALPRAMLNKTWVVVNGAGVHGRHMRFVNRTPQEVFQMLEAGATVTFVTEEEDARYDDPRFAVFRNGLTSLESFKGAQLQPLLDTIRRTEFGRLQFNLTAYASAADLAYALSIQFANQLDGQAANSLVSGLAAWTRLTNGDLVATCERILGIPGYDDLRFDPRARDANGLGLIEALCKQKGISLISAQQLIYDSHTTRLHVVKVPKCAERFSTILNTVVDHALGYYSAVAMNDRAIRFGQGQFGEILNGMLNGQFNTGFPPEYSARFQLLHMAAEGRLQVKDLNRIIGTSYKSRAEVVRAFQEFVQKCRDKLARGIDAVLHQAKFVTVGATRQGFELRVGSAIDGAIKSKAGHPLFEGADPVMLRSLYTLYSQDLKTQVQIVPVSEDRARIFVVCQDKDGITNDIEASMKDAGCVAVSRDNLVFDIPSSQSTMQVFDVSLSAEQAHSQGAEDAITRGLIERRLATVTQEEVKYSGPKKAVPKAIETIANSTISLTASLTLPSSGKQLLRPEIKLSNAQFPSSVREQITSGKIRRIIFIGDGTANNVGEAAKNTAEGYVRDIRNLLVKEAAERGTSLSKYDLHFEVSSMTAVQAYSFGMTDDMSDALVIGIAGDRELNELTEFMDAAQGHGAQLLAITQEGNADHKQLEALVAGKKGGFMSVRDSGEGLYAPMAGISVYNMELARLFSEGVCAAAKRDSNIDLRLAGRMEAVILDDIVELRYAMPSKLRRFFAASEEKSTPVAQGINQAAKFWPHRKVDWKLLGDGPGFAITQYGRILVARLCGKATEGDYVENYKHKDTSTESYVILLTANLRGTGDNYNLDVLSELEKWRAHESFVVIVSVEGDNRFDSFGITATDAAGAVIEKRSAFPVVSVPQTSERFSGFLLGAATDAIIENIANAMEQRVNQLRTARSAILDSVDPKKATANMLKNRNFVTTLSTQCGPITTDMLKGMYNAYLPTALSARFIGLYTLLIGIMTTEDLATYVGKDYANTGGIEAAYRDFCDLLGQMADTMSMRPASAKTYAVAAQEVLDANRVKIDGQVVDNPEAVQIFRSNNTGTIGNGRPGLVVMMRENIGIGAIITTVLAENHINVYEDMTFRLPDDGHPSMVYVIATDQDCPVDAVAKIQKGLKPLTVRLLPAAPVAPPEAKQGSLSPELSRLLLNFNNPAARQVSRQKMERLAERGVVFEGNKDFIFIGEEVDENNIESGAIILDGAIIVGKNTKIGAKAIIEGIVIDSAIGRSAGVIGNTVIVSSDIGAYARITGTARKGCKVFEATIGEGADLLNSIVVTQDFDATEPEAMEYDERHAVAAQRTVIGAGSAINHSFVKNSGIGENSVLEWSDAEACRIGKDNKLYRLKTKLTRTGNKFVVDGHYKDGKPAPNEIQEAWMPACASILGAEGYYEGIFLSHFPTENETVHPLAFGPVAANRPVFSSFTGDGKTKGHDKVDSVNSSPVASSQHNHMIIYPLLYMGSRLNVVGQPDYCPVNKHAPIGITALLPLSLPGAKPWTSVWGPVSGERSSPYWEDEQPIIQFYQFPQLAAGRLIELLEITKNNWDDLIADIEEEGLTVDTDRKNMINHLLLARADFYQKILDNAAAVGLEEKDAIRARFKEAAEIARAQAESGLWDLDDKGELKHWTRDATGKPVLKEDVDTQNIVRGLVNEGRMLDPEAWPSEEEVIQRDYDDPADATPISTEIFEKAPEVTAAREMHELPDNLKGYKHLFVYPGTRIGDGVAIQDGTAERPTIIWPGVTLERSGVSSGVELLGARGTGINFKEGVRCDLVEASGEDNSLVNISQDSFLAFSTVEANKGTPLNIGKGVTTRGAKVINESVGDDTTLFYGARLENGYTGAKCKIGCPKINVKGNPDGTGADGDTMQHLASRVMNGRMLSRGTVHGANIAAGVFAEGKEGKEFELHRGVFVGTNRRVEPSVRIGALSYVIANVPQGTRLHPLTLYQVRPGRENPVNLSGTRIGILLRMGIGYQYRYATNEEQAKAVALELESDECDLVEGLVVDLVLLADQKTGTTPPEVQELKQEADKALAYIRQNTEDQIDFPNDTERALAREVVFRHLLEANVPSVRAANYARDDIAMKEILDAIAETGARLKNGLFRVRDGEFRGIGVPYNRSSRPGWSRWTTYLPGTATPTPIGAAIEGPEAREAVIAGI